MDDDFDFLSDREFEQALAELEEAARQAKGRRKLEPIARRLELSLRKAFRAQQVRFLREFRRQMRSRFAEGFEGHDAFLSTPLKEAFTPAEWWTIWYEVASSTSQLLIVPIEEGVRRALLTGGVQAVLGMGIRFDLANPRAVRYMQDYGALRVTRINEETRTQLQTILDAAVNDGWSYSRTAEAITAKFEQFAAGSPLEHIDSRAHLVAVTEIGDAYTEANLIVAQDLQAAGIDMEKFWSTVGDDKVSQTVCLPNEQQGWIPVSQEFQSGHQRPLGHPGCRCDLLTRRKANE